MDTLGFDPRERRPARLSSTIKNFLDRVELHTFSYKGIRDCYKCVYEVGCHESPLGCKKYKRDAYDEGIMDIF